MTAEMPRVSVVVPAWSRGITTSSNGAPVRFSASHGRSDQDE